MPNVKDGSNTKQQIRERTKAVVEFVLCFLYSAIWRGYSAQTRGSFDLIQAEAREGTLQPAQILCPTSSTIELKDSIVKMLTLKK